MRGDVARVFETAEHVFYLVALAVAALFDRVGFFAVLLVGNDGFGLAFFQPRPQIVAVVNLVGQQLLWRFERFQQRPGRLDVRGVSRRKQKRYRAALFIRCGMDFRRASITAFADGFRTTPFLPLAERCALMIVESMLFS